MGAQAGSDGRSDFPGEPQAVAVYTQQLTSRGRSHLTQETQQHPGPGSVTQKPQAPFKARIMKNLKQKIDQWKEPGQLGKDQT